MSIYSIIDIIGFSFALYCILFNRNNRRLQNRFIYLFLTFWAILVSFRGYGVGNDTSGYAYFFSGEIYDSLKFVNYGTIENPNEDLESGFVWICKGLSYISNSPTFLFTIIAILFFSAIYRLYINKIFGIIGLLWLFTSTFSMMNIIYVSRQCLSLAILLWGIIIIEKINIKWVSNSDNVKKSIFIGMTFIILSLFVHRTSIFLTFIYLILKYVNISKKLAYISVISTFLLALFFYSSILFYFDLFFSTIDGISVQNLDVLSRYANTMEGEYISFLNLASFTLPCLVTIYFSSKEEINSLSFKCYVLAICFVNMFSSSVYMLRFIVFFFILGYPLAVPKVATNNKLLFSFYLSITIYYLFKMLNIYANWPIKISSDLPYMFFWE